MAKDTSKAKGSTDPDISDMELDDNETPVPTFPIHTPNSPDTSGEWEHPETPWEL